MQKLKIEPIHFKSTIQAATPCHACGYHPIQFSVTLGSGDAITRVQLCARCTTLGADYLETMLYQRRPEVARYVKKELPPWCDSHDSNGELRNPRRAGA